MSERSALVCLPRSRWPGGAAGRVKARWQWRDGQHDMSAPRVSRPARSRVWSRCAWGILGLGAALACLLHLSQGDAAFARQLSDGCDELEACRRLEAEAETRVAACWFGCWGELADQRLARLQRYRVEEQRAVREHYRQRDQEERVERDAERERELAALQRRDAARTLEAEREHQRQLELERSRQAYVDQRLAEQRQHRVSYLQLLGVEGRAQRLRRCHDLREGCDVLILDLIEAARDEREKRALAASNESLLHPAPKPKVSAEVESVTHAKPGIDTAAPDTAAPETAASEAAPPDTGVLEAATPSS